MQAQLQYKYASLTHNRRRLQRTSTVAVATALTSIYVTTSSSQQPTAQHRVGLYDAFARMNTALVAVDLERPRALTAVADASALSEHVARLIGGTHSPTAMPLPICGGFGGGGVRLTPNMSDLTLDETLALSAALLRDSPPLTPAYVASQPPTSAMWSSRLTQMAQAKRPLPPAPPMPYRWRQLTNVATAAYVSRASQTAPMATTTTAVGAFGRRRVGPQRSSMPEFLSLSLSPPMGRRREMPALRGGGFISL